MNFFFDSPITGILSVIALFTLVLLLKVKRLIPNSVSNAIRLATLLLALLAAFTPVLFLSGAPPKVVFLVDESPSMQPYLAKLTLRINSEIKALPKHVEVEVTGFSSTIRTIASNLYGGDETSVELFTHGRGTSSPQELLQKVYARVSSLSNAIVILYTDGAFDRPSSSPPPENIRLVCRPLDAVNIYDCGVANLSLPYNISAGSKCSAAVTAFSNYPTNAAISLSVNGRIVSSSRVRLRTGTREFLIPLSFATPGLKTIEAKVITEDLDSFPVNDLRTKAILVSGSSQIPVVYLSQEDKEEAQAWASYIGNDATITNSIPDLRNESDLILVNFPGRSIPPTLREFVLNGGNLLLTGGENAFDRTMISHSIEDVIPVNARDSDDGKLDFLAVIDKSGSLDCPVAGTGQTRFGLLKSGLIAMLGLSDENTHFGCIAYDRIAKIVVAPDDYSKAEKRKTAQANIGNLLASGGTNLAPALSMALETLRESKLEKKHLVLYMDGEGDIAGGDYLPIARRIKENGISATIVAIGEYRNNVVEDLEEALGATVLRVTSDNWSQVPTLLKALLSEKKGEPIRRRTSKLQFMKNMSMLLNMELPAESASIEVFNVTKVKEESTIFISALPDNLPIAATIRSGYGRSSVFCSSLRKNWLGGSFSAIGGNFLEKFLSYTFSNRLSNRANLNILESGDTQYILANISDEDGNPLLNADVRVLLSSDDRIEEHKLLSFDAGKYRAEISSYEKPFTGTLYVNEAPRGVFPLTPFQQADPVVNRIEYQQLRDFASGIAGTFEPGKINLSRSFPGWQTIFSLLGLLFCMLVILEQALSLPSVRRYMSNVYYKRKT